MFYVTENDILDWFFEEHFDIVQHKWYNNARNTNVIFS